MHDVPFLDWDAFLAKFRWKQGEHMTLVGPTGQGKTTLALNLLPRRKYVVVFATKRRDPVVDKLKSDYEVLPEFIGNTRIAAKVVLKPARKGSIAQTRAHHRTVFGNALETAFAQGGWTVYMDEGHYICDHLKLAPSAEMLWQQGRSLGVTLVTSVQRPVKIPLFAYDGATHLFFWRDNDETNIKRIGGLGGHNRKEIQSVVAGLPRHEVLYLDSRSGVMVRTKTKVN